MRKFFFLAWFLIACLSLPACKKDETSAKQGSQVALGNSQNPTFGNGTPSYGALRCTGNCQIAWRVLNSQITAYTTDNHGQLTVPAEIATLAIGVYDSNQQVAYPLNCGRQGQTNLDGKPTWAFTCEIDGMTGASIKNGSITIISAGTFSFEGFSYHDQEYGDCSIIPRPDPITGHYPTIAC